MWGFFLKFRVFKQPVCFGGLTCLLFLVLKLNCTTKAKKCCKHNSNYCVVILFHSAAAGLYGH